MGRNSQQRRAGRRRGRPAAHDPREQRPRDRGAVQALVRAAMYRLGADGCDPGRARAAAEAVLARVHPDEAGVVAEVATAELSLVLATALAGGWGPADLIELVSRSGDPCHLPALLTGLHREARGNPARGSAWSQSLAAYGADPRWRLHTTEQLGSALVVSTVLMTAPLLRADALVGDLGRAPAHPKLARVRALLAKAESTTYPEEAEALSAKAQELIARYSLDDLASAAGVPGPDRGITTCRVWLDAPYLRAKSSLVHVVASANHASTAWSQQHGFMVVVGTRGDLDAVELLVTSLLVQADRAMLAHGRRADWSGTSRTRSFRQSFLEAYAARVGQRLVEVGEAMVARDPDRFLPVLRDHDRQVREAFEAVVPHVRGRSSSVSNHDGWVAGLAAGDLAQLGVRGPIAPGTG